MEVTGDRRLRNLPTMKMIRSHSLHHVFGNCVCSGHHSSLEKIHRHFLPLIFPVVSHHLLKKWNCPLSLIWEEVFSFCLSCDEGTLTSSWVVEKVIA